MTPEGLRLQLFDREGAPMFLPASAEPTPRLARMLGVVGSVLATVPNEVVVAGHTLDVLQPAWEHRTFQHHVAAVDLHDMQVAFQDDGHHLDGVGT